MLLDLLNFFPAHTHPLTLVSDPDRLLASEAITQALTERGFSIIAESDPVIMRYQVEEARPFSPENPLILITFGPLEEFPFDLYQQAYRLKLSLHQFFPHFAYPILQLLTPDQIEVLGSCQLPAETLSRQKTIEFVLREVFAADPALLSQPKDLITWLMEYHQRKSPLAPLLRSALVTSLKQFPVYQDWDLERLIKDQQAFSNFLNEQWQIALEGALTGKKVSETAANYIVPFHQDKRLQALLPMLVHEGALQPIELASTTGLPDWATPGVSLIDGRPKRFALLLDDLAELLDQAKAGIPEQISWKMWQEIAQQWAELSNLALQADSIIQNEQKVVAHRLMLEMDKLFADWLRLNYRALGAQRLPEPHHVYHIPHYLAYQRELKQFDKVVLFVLDGLSLADWEIIRTAWSARHKHWSLGSKLILAQIPTITAVSRVALTSGLRPAEFLQAGRPRVTEARAWQLFWTRQNIPESASRLLSLSYDRKIDQRSELEDPNIHYWCLVDDTIDQTAHNALFGSAGQQAALHLWLDLTQEKNSQPLENLIDRFLDQGYAVFLTSDHGHVEATGFGQPAEGLLAETRGKRARLYADRLAALQVQNAFPDTILWENDGILPANLFCLMPLRRKAFTYSGQVVVTHGGITIEEEIVPFVQITKED